MSTKLALPGNLNGPLVGLAMKEMARRAMASIARNRMSFEATAKETVGKTEDFVTTADNEAQEIYLRTICEAFPTYGVIAEEDSLSIPCKEPGHDTFFTVDPLDGTKAFIRGQSHGIGTMISLVVDGFLVAACVGDVMTGEIYYFRPGSNKVHRFSWNDSLHTRLSIDATKPLAGQYVLLGDDPRNMSSMVEEITNPNRSGKAPVFKNIEVMGGSIGVRFARLWKGEVGAIILPPGRCTPWDWCPIAGISAKLGFVGVGFDGSAWRSFRLRPIKEVENLPNEVIILHKSRLKELIARMR